MTGPDSIAVDHVHVDVNPSQLVMSLNFSPHSHQAAAAWRRGNGQ